MLILSTESAAWRRAKKTQPIRAKSMVNLLIDKSVMSKFLIDTLEGREPIGPDTMFCIGGAGDPWQQTATKLLKKYDVTSVDEDGWMVCTPKPENEVEFFIAETDGFIQGQWGETIEGVGQNLQRVKVGDSVARQPYDHLDQWVVNRKLWNNTYKVLGE